jgi:hypothetical protein
VYVEPITTPIPFLAGGVIPLKADDEQVQTDVGSLGERLPVSKVEN